MNFHLSPASLLEHVVLHVYFGRVALFFHKFAEPSIGLLAVLANGSTQVELLTLAAASAGLLLLILGRRHPVERAFGGVERAAEGKEPSLTPLPAMSVGTYTFEEETTTTETNTKSVKTTRKIVYSEDDDAK